jgi:xylan 1,4-beta-xylosidase
VADTLEFCASQQVPIDFVSTHIYPDDPQKVVFGEGVRYPFEEVIPRALAKVKGEIKASKYPDIPLYISEWSSQIPAFIAHVVKSTIGLADILSYWTFDNIFEELGVPHAFFNNSLGLIGQRGIPRPSYYTFVLLHKLGDERLDCGDGPVLATRRKDGAIAVLAWNLIPRLPGQHSSTGGPLLQAQSDYAHNGESLKLVLSLEGARGHHAQLTRVDGRNEKFQQFYEQMGSPVYPTSEQIARLAQASELSAPEILPLSSKKQIALTIPANAVALLEIA